MLQDAGSQTVVQDVCARAVDVLYSACVEDSGGLEGVQCQERMAQIVLHPVTALGAVDGLELSTWVLVVSDSYHSQLSEHHDFVIPTSGRRLGKTPFVVTVPDDVL
jgi:hypothetical protein